MGQVCAQEGLQVKKVTSLGMTKGHRKKDQQGAVLDEGGGELKKQISQRVARNHHTEKERRLTCPSGHAMAGYVPREVFNMKAVCGKACRDQHTCEECDDELGDEGSYYVCRTCSIYYCNSCARERMGLPEQPSNEPVGVLAGDIFLAGPDPMGIHHVILARSDWRKADPDVAEILEMDHPGLELLACETIESTQGSIGDSTWWYPTTSFFTRDEVTGQVSLVADLPPDSNTVERAMNPVPTKVLLHPFRAEDGSSEIDDDVFEEVIDAAAAASQKYGKRTAVRSALAGLADAGFINEASHPDKLKLLEDIRKSWDNKPICASVAIRCWQQYFDQASDSPEEAAQEILTYMPHWCHKSTPQLMVKTLTTRGWVLIDHMGH